MLRIAIALLLLLVVLPQKGVEGSKGKGKKKKKVTCPNHTKYNVKNAMDVDEYLEDKVVWEAIDSVFFIFAQQYDHTGQFSLEKLIQFNEWHEVEGLRKSLGAIVKSLNKHENYPDKAARYVIYIENQN